jgi:hypothetical protein
MNKLSVSSVLGWLARIPWYVHLLIPLVLAAVIGTKWGALTYVGTSLALFLWQSERWGQPWNVYKRITPRIVIESTIVLLIVSVTGLMLRQLPVLNWSWMNLFGGEGENFLFSAATIEGWGLLILGMFIVAIPTLARMEEFLFRATPMGEELSDLFIEQGILGWWPSKISLKVEGGSLFQRIFMKWAFSGWVLRSLTFGLVHCLAGVPLGVGLAITLAGLWFSWQYKKGGIERSTIYHSTNNLIAAILILAVILFV